MEARNQRQPNNHRNIQLKQRPTGNVVEMNNRNIAQNMTYKHDLWVIYFRPVVNILHRRKNCIKIRQKNGGHRSKFFWKREVQKYFPPMRKVRKYLHLGWSNWQKLYGKLTTEYLTVHVWIASRINILDAAYQG
jgi:hypothetical protein